MTDGPNIRNIYEVIKQAILFVDGLEQLKSAILRRATRFSLEAEEWELQFVGNYEGETFYRDILIHVTSPEMKVELISDEPLQ